MIYRLLFKLVLRRIDAEDAHALAAGTLRTVASVPGVARLLRALLARRDDRLEVRALGLTFPSPLGVAAGMDKDATWFESLGSLGFGFVEIGSVTPHAQAGNPRPRVHRLVDDRGLLNHMGFPNAGASAAAARLSRRSGRTLVGANVGKSKDTPLDQAATDYRAVVRQLGSLSDFLVLNVSSPNTPGLRGMQSVRLLEELIDGVRQELAEMGQSRPMLIKISPDLLDEEVDAIADLAIEREIDGLVAVNTSIGRDRLKSDPAMLQQPGGVSGCPLQSRSLELLRRLRVRVGDRLVLIAVGGIETTDDAWERIRAGATLVQAYTGFVYGGPLWPRRINRGLAERVSACGAENVQELVGSERSDFELRRRTAATCTGGTR